MSKAAAVLFAVLAVAYFVAQPAPSRGPLPDDARALAARVAEHPADWLAASALAERALDMRVPGRVELWRTSGALAISLAPWVREPRASFARGGFFHWYELSPADRRSVLDAYTPLLSDPTIFETMAGPLFDLTGDFAYLRRVRPPGDTAMLAQIAAANGLFDDYRALRAELPNEPRGAKIDSRDIDAKKEVTVTIAREAGDEVPPYVEIRADDVLRDEGAVDTVRKFTFLITGRHALTVWVVNPGTRNRAARRARVTRVEIL